MKGAAGKKGKAAPAKGKGGADEPLNFENNPPF